MFKKNASIKERANAALSSLQRNAYAMGMLRSRLESRINFVVKESSGKTEGYQDLSRVLELVKNGELILQAMSEKVESARFLEEFVIIMDSAASSVSEIKGDIEQMMPAAEAGLEAMYDTISKVSVGLTDGLRKEIEPAILAELAAATTADTGNAIVAAEMKEATTSHIEKEQEPESVPA